MLIRIFLFHSFNFRFLVTNMPCFFQFLTENGYAHNVSMKSLQSPSVKDFLKIFTFVYGFLCPSYELPDSKFEEEVPKVFKELG